MRFELLLPAQSARPPFGRLSILHGHTFGTDRPRAGFAFGFLDNIDALLGPPIYGARLIPVPWGLLNHIARDLVEDATSHFRPLEQGGFPGEFLVDFFRNDSGSNQAHKGHHQY